MSTSRDFPFSFSAEARAVLGSPDALNLAVRTAFPELEAGWAGRTATFATDNLSGRAVVTRAGTLTPAHTVLGLFAGTISLGSEPRGLFALPLPAFRVGGVEVLCFVDGAARASRRPSAAEAVLYRHTCRIDHPPPLRPRPLRRHHLLGLGAPWSLHASPPGVPRGRGRCALFRGRRRPGGAPPLGGGGGPVPSHVRR